MKIGNKNAIKHGMTRTKIYTTWNNMKQRCRDKNAHGYSDYGGRGIKVCEEWLKFENFYKDMGKHPEGKTLDRINNNGNYCKENCRWATPKEQGKNKRNNVLLTNNGKTQTISDWAREVNIGRPRIRDRILHGWSVEDALTIRPKLGNGTRGKSPWNKGLKFNKIIKKMKNKKEILEENEIDAQEIEDEIYEGDNSDEYRELNVLERDNN